MTIGDIKRDALILMGYRSDNQTVQYNQQQQSEIMSNMNNSILRALDRMRSKGLFNKIWVEVFCNDNFNHLYNFNADDLFSMGELISIRKATATGFENVDFVQMGSQVYFYFEIGYKYYCEIYPTVDLNLNDDYSLPISDGLARLIPYFIKADLYEDEQPSLAALSRNIFELSLSEYVTRADNCKMGVKAKYGIFD